MERGVERNNGAPGCDGSEIYGDPAGVVVSQESQAGAAGKSIFGRPTPDGFGHAAEFGVGVTLKLIVTLQLDSGIVRPALRAFYEAVIESGHGKVGMGRGEYTRKLCGPPKGPRPRNLPQ